MPLEARRPGVNGRWGLGVPLRTLRAPSTSSVLNCSSRFQLDQGVCWDAVLSWSCGVEQFLKKLSTRFF